MRLASGKNGFLGYRLSSYLFFITANIVGMFAGYFLELYTRRDFLQRRALEFEKTKSESLLQKEAEEALRASEEHFRSLIENASDGIAVTDPEGRFVYVSPAYERIWVGRLRNSWGSRSYP